MKEMQPAEIWRVLRELENVTPEVAIEPAHIQEWKIERQGLGPAVVSPPELERVTLTYRYQENVVTVTVYDRELDIVNTFELAEFMRRF